jgi:5'-nucleotidase
MTTPTRPVLRYHGGKWRLAPWILTFLPPHRSYVEPFGGARFSFLAANVSDASGSTIFPGSVVRQFGPIRIGFIGMTLKDTRTLVTLAGVAGLTFADEAQTANALVRKLKAAGANAIVLLIHQGGKAPQIFREAGCDGLAGPILDIMDKLDPAISVIVSGHTHQAYTCRVNRGGAERLVQAALYSLPSSLTT